MCGGFCGRRLDVGGASWAARIVAAALILALAPTTPTAGWLLCAGRTFEMSCFGWQRCVNCGGAWSVVDGAGRGMAVARVCGRVFVLLFAVWCGVKIVCTFCVCVCVCCWSAGVVSFGVGVCCDCGSRSGAGAGSVTLVSVARGALRSWRTCGAACVIHW